MLQQLFQQPAVEIAFVDLLRVPVDFFITLKPGNIPCHAVFVGVFAGLVVFRATVGHLVIGMTQGILEEITAELLSQHTAGIIHGVLGFSLQIKLTAREDQRIIMGKQKIRNFLPVLQNNIPPPGL